MYWNNVFNCVLEKMVASKATIRLLPKFTFLHRWFPGLWLIFKIFLKSGFIQRKVSWRLYNVTVFGILFVQHAYIHHIYNIAFNKVMKTKYESFIPGVYVCVCGYTDINISMYKHGSTYKVFRYITQLFIQLNNRIIHFQCRSFITWLGKYWDK